MNNYNNYNYYLIIQYNDIYVVIYMELLFYFNIIKFSYDYFKFLN